MRSMSILPSNACIYTHVPITARSEARFHTKDAPFRFRTVSRLSTAAWSSCAYKLRECLRA